MHRPPRTPPGNFMKTCFRLTLVAACLALPAGARTFELETTEVTAPGLTASPDGKNVIFNLLGHLFRVSAGGGAATQLTFGPAYDSDPVYSPDGTKLAFLSSRDGSDGNIFVMDVASGRVTQLTREFMAGTPSWSPDGKTIAFLSYLRREEYPLERIPGFAGSDTGVLLTVPAAGGATQRISEPRTFVSVFYLPDGRLGWTVAERAPGPVSLLGPPPVTATVVEARSPQGTISQLGRLAGIPGGVGRVSLNAKGDGFYYIAGGSLRQFLFGETQPTTVGAFAGQGRLTPLSGSQMTFAAANAKLWRIPIPGGSREPLDFTARVKMEGLEPLTKKWTPATGTVLQPRAVLSPQLSPDGRTLVFMAAGYLWEQALGGGQARKLVDDHSFQLNPAFSPDGKQVVFTSDLHGKREVRVVDLATRQTRTLASLAGASWPLFPSWSRDGKSIVYQRSDQIGAPYQLLKVDAQGGTPQMLTQTSNNWTARPQFSADANTLYYTARTAGVANFFRLALKDGAKPEAVTDLTRHVHDGLVSPDGRWLAFRRNHEIWIARLESRTLKDADFRRFSAEGGRSFSFTSDSSAIVYAEGARVWRKNVEGAQAMEIPIRASLSRSVEAPLLISRVRALDLAGGKFGSEASIFVEQGRIRWIGPEAGRTIPSNAIRIDGAGRFAIPGLTDSHTHTAWSNQQITEDSLIAYGVTSIRDTGSRIELINALADRGETTSLPIPRYFGSGDIFEGLMPLWGDAFLEIATKEEGREYVQRYKNQGAAFIKLYSSLPWFVKTPAAEEAHRLGMPTVGHGLSAEEIVRSVNLGFASLEHTGPLNEDMLKLLAASGTRWDPTSTIGTGTRIMLSDPAKNLDTKFRAFIPADSIEAARPGGAVADPVRAAWLGNLSLIRRAHDSGVKILDGTDSLMTGIFHGPSLQWNLGFFADADLRTIDVLRIATTGAAEAMGAAAEMGALEPGKLGDIVLLDGNPLDDVRNTGRIWRVIKGGHVFDPATMR